MLDIKHTVNFARKISPIALMTGYKHKKYQKVIR